MITTQFEEWNGLCEDAVFHDLSTNDYVDAMPFWDYIEQISKEGTDMESYYELMSPYCQYLHKFIFGKLDIEYDTITKKVKNYKEFETNEKIMRYYRDDAFDEALECYINQKSTIKIGDLVQSFDTYGGRWHYHMYLVVPDKGRKGLLSFGEGIGMGDMHDRLGKDLLEVLPDLNYKPVSKELVDRDLIPVWDEEIEDDPQYCSLLYELHRYEHTDSYLYQV